MLLARSLRRSTFRIERQVLAKGYSKEELTVRRIPRHTRALDRRRSGKEREQPNGSSLAISATRRAVGALVVRSDATLPTAKCAHRKPHVRHTGFCLLQRTIEEYENLGVFNLNQSRTRIWLVQGVA